MAPRKTRRGAAAPAGAQASPMRKKATAQLMKDKARHEKDVIPETPLSANASPAASSPVQRPARAGGAGGAFAHKARAPAPGVRASPLKRTRMRLVNRVRSPRPYWPPSAPLHH